MLVSLVKVNELSSSSACECQWPKRNVKLLPTLLTLLITAWQFPCQPNILWTFTEPPNNSCYSRPYFLSTTHSSLLLFIPPGLGFPQSSAKDSQSKQKWKTKLCPVVRFLKTTNLCILLEEFRAKTHLKLYPGSCYTHYHKQQSFLPLKTSSPAKSCESIYVIDQ